MTDGLSAAALLLNTRIDAALGSSRYNQVAIGVLIDARSQADLTQRELAGRLGKPPSFVAKVETGERRLDFVELVAIAR